jgi:hypothetical protein
MWFSSSMSIVTFFLVPAAEGTDGVPLEKGAAGGEKEPKFWVAPTKWKFSGDTSGRWLMEKMVGTVDNLETHQEDITWNIN